MNLHVSIYSEFCAHVEFSSVVYLTFVASIFYFNIYDPHLSMTKQEYIKLAVSAVNGYSSGLLNIGSHILILE
jgi:hypothetical protein